MNRIVPAWSLRARVTATVVAILAVTLFVAGVVVDLGLTAALGRDQRSGLADRAARADALVARQVPPDQLVALLDGQGVRATRLAATGAVLQGAPGPPGPRGPRGGPPREDGPRGPRAPLAVEKPLDDGSVLRLSSDPGEVEAVLSRLRGVMVGVGVVGLVVSALVLLTGVTIALRPLDAMTRVARAIAGGERGRRLRPRTDRTEIGRTAAAFDEMLDALDAAQDRSESSAREARESEATTRRFLSDAAHELRTPLAGMQTLAETLVRDSDDDREVREELAIALVRETSRAASLVTDMLDLARIEGGQELERTEVDLAALAAEQVDRLRLLDPGLDVAVDATGPVPARVDVGRVRRILVNLLDNARRHVPDGGSVRVRVRDGEVVVHNDGEVVAETDRDRIFDRLVRLDSARARDAGGAGLGLSIARALARAHGGDVVYRAAADGSGSDLVVTLRSAVPPTV
ncbi:HAMP domain-containing sensor histidine kinase [Actinomycetospora sp. OC33-EN08]|uniref:histidine kinase n=1 Tax=Actinomycetospora aurantiaca TaxID=3129233 RepID=A0ABU8MUT1_9PSEU